MYRRLALGIAVAPLSSGAVAPGATGVTYGVSPINDVSESRSGSNAEVE